MLQTNSMANAPNPPEHGSPDPEHYEGVNFPYRGTQMHGVKPPYQPIVPGDEAPEYATVNVPTVDTPDEGIPIPVRVVNTAGREIRRFRTIPGIVGGTNAELKEQVVGRDLNRTRVRITNMDADTILYYGDDMMMTTTGFPIRPGASEDIYTEDPVYVMSADATEIQWRALMEYTIAEQ